MLSSTGGDAFPIEYVKSEDEIALESALQLTKQVLSLLATRFLKSWARQQPNGYLVLITRLSQFAVRGAHKSRTPNTQVSGDMLHHFVKPEGK